MNGKNKFIVSHWIGRFGNRLHTFAYSYEFSREFNMDLYFPSEWEGDKIFNLVEKYKIIDDEELRNQLNETHGWVREGIAKNPESIKKYAENNKFTIKYLDPHNSNENWKKPKDSVFIDSTCAYNSNNFKYIELSSVHKLFEFNEEVKNSDLYKRMEDEQRV